MNSRRASPLLRLCAAGLALTWIGGCGALRPSATQHAAFYSLDSARVEAPTTTRAPGAASSAAATLIVNPPHAAAGFDSQRIIYSREAHKLQYFARSEWVDTPARMLAPLIVTAVEAHGGFRAVVLTPSAAAGDLRLDTEILRLQHDFFEQPSRVRFTLRAYIVDNATRKVLASREFDETVAANSADAHGGVLAAHRAVTAVLARLASFCAETAGAWTPSPSGGGTHRSGPPAIRQ